MNIYSIKGGRQMNVGNILLWIFIINGVLYFTIKSAVKLALEEFYKENKT